MNPSVSRNMKKKVIAKEFIFVTVVATKIILTIYIFGENGFYLLMNAMKPVNVHVVGCRRNQKFLTSLENGSMNITIPVKCLDLVGNAMKEMMKRLKFTGMDSQPL